MAERDLGAEIVALIEAREVRPVVFLYADFPSGVRRLWTGLGVYTDASSNLWLGLGGLVRIDAVQESQDIGAKGITVGLNSLNPAFVSSLMGEEYQGRQCYIRLAFWKEATGDVIFTPGPLWKGVLDTDAGESGRDRSSLNIICEHRMVDILRKRTWRYTQNDQDFLYPDALDTGLNKMTSIQDKVVPWGRAA